MQLISQRQLTNAMQEYGWNVRTQLNTNGGIEMENQEQVKDWLVKEEEELNKQTNFDGEKLPALQFEEGKVVKFKVDFSEPFNEFDDVTNKCIKAIIPVTHKEEKKILWLNKKNPLYKDIIHKGREGVTNFAVSQTGNKANTKYFLVEED